MVMRKFSQDEENMAMITVSTAVDGSLGTGTKQLFLSEKAEFETGFIT
jgi:hypothetical protein